MKRFAAVLFVAGCLGGASDAYALEASPPTVSVEGVASAAVSMTASQAEADAAYRQALAAAIGDGHGKAEFLAAQTGAKVASIQQIVEHGGSIDCVVHAEVGPLTDWVEYKGAQPDFGSIESSGARFVAAPEAPSRRVAAKAPVHKKKRRKAKAKKAAAVTCTLSTQVGLAYLLM
jgi:hypothetical protein